MKKVFVILVLFVFLSTMIFAQPEPKECKPTTGSGAIWTTNGDCGNETQDVNHFAVGDKVFVNGACFDSAEYDWTVAGQPGGASSDPGIDVADGKFTVDSSYNFCFEAYTVQPGDDGEYTVDFGKKNDNYHVKETSGVPEFNTLTFGLAVVTAGLGLILLRKR